MEKRGKEDRKWRVAAGGPWHQPSYPLDQHLQRAAARHSLTSLPNWLRLAVASVRPSGLKHRALTGPEPHKVNSSCPVPTCHSFTALSTLPDASVRPSGLKATAVTRLSCPFSSRTRSVFRSTRSTAPNPSPTARRRPP